MKIDPNNIVDIVYWAFRTVTPWRIRAYTEGGEWQECYSKGWNDCLKELKKRQKNYIKNLEKIGK